MLFNSKKIRITHMKFAFPTDGNSLIKYFINLSNGEYIIKIKVNHHERQY